jgi:hypothetical protein
MSRRPLRLICVVVGAALLATVVSLSPASPDPARPAFAQAASPVTFRFDGGGWGHGVGMSQWGAKGRADAGQSATQILQAYYTGTQVTSRALGNIRVHLASPTSTDVVISGTVDWVVNGVGRAWSPAGDTVRVSVVADAITIQRIAPPLTRRSSSPSPARSPPSPRDRGAGARQRHGPPLQRRPSRLPRGQRPAPDRQRLPADAAVPLRSRRGAVVVADGRDAGPGDRGAHLRSAKAAVAGEPQLRPAVDRLGSGVRRLREAGRSAGGSLGRRRRRNRRTGGDPQRLVDRGALLLLERRRDREQRERLHHRAPLPEERGRPLRRGCAGQPAPLDPLLHRHRARCLGPQVAQRRSRRGPGDRLQRPLRRVGPHRQGPGEAHRHQGQPHPLGRRVPVGDQRQRARRPSAVVVARVQPSVGRPRPGDLRSRRRARRGVGATSRAATGCRTSRSSSTIRSSRPSRRTGCAPT